MDEVVNYVRAMNQGLARLRELPVSVRLIRQIHGELLHGVRGSHLTPGELRRTQNWIGPPGSTLSPASFVPPPPEEVSAALGALEQFLHNDDDLPLSLKIGLAHAQFETIHPFLDGNGRMGTTFAAANQIIHRLVDAGILVEITGQARHRRFRYDPYVRLFDDN